MKVYDLQKALKIPEKVTELYLHNRGISTFPKAIFSLQNLKKLDLSLNNLNIIPSDITRLCALESLVLSGNKITTLPDKLSNLDQLTRLELKDNALSNIPRVVFELKKLRSLGMANTKIEKLEVEIGKLTNLENLDLSGNTISRLPKSIGNLTSLKNLFLQKNRLSALPNTLFQCHQLLVLDASFNRLKQLDEQFGNLVKLETLDLRRNRLEALPESIGFCKFLRTLNVSFNKISSLPLSICKLKHLRILDFSKNRITKLPADIGNCHALRKIILNKNLLTHLPKSLETCLSLESLDLSENQLTELPDVFQSLDRLKFVELKKNQIRSIPKSFLQLKSLQYLGLGKSPVDLSPEALLGLEKLEKINGQIGIEPETKRKLLQYLKSCKKQNLSGDLRKRFYQLLKDEKAKLSLRTLLEALSFRNQTIQINALKGIIENFSRQQKLKEGSILTILGKTHLETVEVRSILEFSGVLLEPGLTEKTTHVVLGFYAPFNESLLKKEFSFLTETELNDFLKTTSKSKFRSLDVQELEKIRALLLSGRFENIEIAIQFLKTSNNPDAVLTEIFLAYKMVADRGQKAKLRSILAFNLSQEASKSLKLPLGITGKIPQSRFDKTIKKLSEAGFDGEKIKLTLKQKGYLLPEIKKAHL